MRRSPDPLGERHRALAMLNRTAQTLPDPGPALALLADVPATPPPQASARPRRLHGRRYQPRPDRAASRRRRRSLGGRSDAFMPPSVSEAFSEGARGVLVVIAGEVKSSGRCVLAVDAIAARAGVGRTTVRTALSEARRLGLIHVRYRANPGAKNDTNVITITDAEWRSWLKRGRAPTGDSSPIALIANDFSRPTMTLFPEASPPPRPPAASICHPSNKQRARR